MPDQNMLYSMFKRTDTPRVVLFFPRASWFLALQFKRDILAEFHLLGMCGFEGLWGKQWLEGLPAWLGCWLSSQGTFSVHQILQSDDMGHVPMV